MKEYILQVNGFTSTAKFEEDNVENIFKPLIEKLEKLQKEKGRRIMVFVGAPAGIGKTTLTVFLKALASDMGYDNIDVVGIDGFHYYNDYLENNYVEIAGEKVLMKTIKGNELTFDVDKLEKTIISTLQKDTYWPLYDRNIHNPKEDAVLVNSDIVLLEGNYLLLNKGKWNELEKYCDYSIFLNCEEGLLKKRLVNRKKRGGLDHKAALEWYFNSDRVNVLTVLKGSKKADLTLCYDGSKYNVKEGDSL